MGKDAANDGARYSFIYPCFPGFINLIDSVVAIRRVVYEEKRATLEEIANALKGNFEGEERLRAFLLNRCAKFGNDLDESDEIGKDLFLYMNEELKKFNTCVRNGTFHPSYFAWIQHGRLGQVCAATPDGRFQGEALSECLGSVQGMDKNGPIALMRSTSKIPQHHAIGGVATNFRFSKKIMREALPEIKVFIKEFMRNGNFEAQSNVVDQDTLLDALEHPERHRTLLVRVAGYSDYFVDLSPIIQREIISRLEHDEL
jgi:formate C-acetyltransferase